MLFINTRPADRAAALSESLKAAHIDVLDLPLLELSAEPWSEMLAAQYAQLASVQMVVVVSPSAVQFGMKGLQKAGLSLASLQHVKWIAVGEATAQALLQYDLHSEVPEVETSEGMLRLPVLQQLPSSASVAFWRGEGGRQFMMDCLLEQGNTVLNFVLYRRHCPSLTKQILQRHLPQLNGLAVFTVLISSEASWNYWLDLLADHEPLLNRAVILVLGERVDALVEQYRVQHHLSFTAVMLHDMKINTILKQLEAV